jgi:hypothetical protein
MIMTSGSGAVDELLKRVPAFATARLHDEAYISHHDRSPYLVFGDLGRFLGEYLTRGLTRTEDDSILRNSFELLDEMLTSNDTELMNLAHVGVFEGLADKPELLATATDYLSPDAKSVITFWLEKW